MTSRTPVLLVALALTSLLAPVTAQEADTTPPGPVPGVRFDVPVVQGVRGGTYSYTGIGWAWDAATDPEGAQPASGVVAYDVRIHGVIVARTPELSYHADAADGSFSCFRIRAVDVAGNTGPWSPSSCLIVDRGAPILTLLEAPAAGRLQREGRVLDVDTGGRTVVLGAQDIVFTAEETGSYLADLGIELDGVRLDLGWDCDPSWYYDSYCGWTDPGDLGPAGVATRTVRGFAVDNARHESDLHLSYTIAGAAAYEERCLSLASAYCNTIVARYASLTATHVLMGRDASGAWTPLGALEPLAMAFTDPRPTLVGETRDYQVVTLHADGSTSASNVARVTSQHDGARLGELLPGDAA